MVIKIYPTKPMTVTDLVATIKAVFPPNDSYSATTATISIAQAASADEPVYANEPAYAIVTVAAYEMPDIDEELYYMTRDFPLEYKELAEREYVHFDEE
jgi:hypothetical protein